MRDFCDQLVAIVEKHEKENLSWTDKVITKVADYAQNLDILHFGSEKPGDTYYYPPLGIYIFGMVRLYKEVETLCAQYYYKGDAKKGGNNIASLIYNKFKWRTLEKTWTGLDHYLNIA